MQNAANSQKCKLIIKCSACGYVQGCAPLYMGTSAWTGKVHGDMIYANTIFKTFLF